jgi:Phage integrase family
MIRPGGVSNNRSVRLIFLRACVRSQNFRYETGPAGPTGAEESPRRAVAKVASELSSQYYASETFATNSRHDDRYCAHGCSTRVRSRLHRPPVPRPGRRTIALPSFAIDALRQRRSLPYLGQHPVIMFPSTAGTWRDPNNFGRDWRTVREDLGVPEVTTHSFRKTLATLIDEGGLSARVGADHLGHSRVSMTQDVYMTRGKVHAQVADLLDDAISGA